jgi:hypothetical protein
VVLWQNSRLAVLWDLSYILETSHRIALGDIPYRDFVLPYPPLTFVTQAALIKLTGRVFFHHVLYCAVVGGLGTVVTWRILLRILSGIASARTLALLLSLPLTVLGIYSVFPHPFYDCDCTFAILLSLLLLQQAEAGGFRPWHTFFSGIVLAVPVFVKQNTGLAFLGCAVLALAGLAVLQGWRRSTGLEAISGRESAAADGSPLPKSRALARDLSSTRLGCAWAIIGAAAALASGLVIIHFTAGLANYEHWTVQYAASRRMPPFMDMLAIYHNRLLPGWIAAFVAGAILLRCGRGQRLWAWLSAGLMATPFLWNFVYLFLEQDANERAERLLVLWPFLLLMAIPLVLGSVRRRSGIELLLPFVLFGAIHGAFMSQQLWGSTYAIWPLFILLAASCLAPYALSSGQWPAIANLQFVICKVKADSQGCGSHFANYKLQIANYWPLMTVLLISLSLTVAAGCYVSSHERLNYANLSDGSLVRSTLPALAGMTTRGPWIPQFEELVRFSEGTIPRDEGVLLLPGEDLFFYATGRRPHFPVLMFDHTVNPYSPEEIVSLARSHGIRWVVVKRDLQLEEQPMKNQDRLLQLLRQDFQLFESLDNYDVYKRHISGDRVIR